MTAHEDFASVVRARLASVVAATLQAGDVPEGALSRATDEILVAARKYAFEAYHCYHYKRPGASRSACGRSFGGIADPREVTCAGCERTGAYRAALEEAAS